jgi:hypothetical protein
LRVDRFNVNKAAMLNRTLIIRGILGVTIVVMFSAYLYVMITTGQMDQFGRVRIDTPQPTTNPIDMLNTIQANQNAVMESVFGTEIPDSPQSLDYLYLTRITPTPDANWLYFYCTAMAAETTFGETNTDCQAWANTLESEYLDAVIACQAGPLDDFGTCVVEQGAPEMPA